MSISFDKNDQTFELQTHNTCYQMRVDETGLLRHLYYGRKVGKTNMRYLEKSCDRGFSGNPYDFQEDRGCSADVMPQEYSTFGVGDYRPSALSVVLANGSRSAELKYIGFDIESGKNELAGLPYVRQRKDTVSSLTVKLWDETAGIAVYLIYGVFEEKDVITRSAMICNESQSSVKLLKAASVCIDYPYGNYDLIHFSGRHCMERKPERVQLSQSLITVESKRGMSSHHANPFVILCDHHADEDFGDCYGFMLMYSGSHKEEICRDFTGSVRLVSGIHDEEFCWLLEPGKTFQTPEAILAFSDHGLNGLSGKYHQILRKNVCDSLFTEGKQPVLLNSWEACYFDYDTEKLLKLADESKNLGIELFVLDDGWFGNRENDHKGLGDWFANRKKLPGGLKKLSDEIHRRGMQFGIWLEPEMVNEDSELYRAHPDWILCDPGRKPVIARNQMVLDLTRPEVRNYLFKSISMILRDAGVEYIKWDFNRSISNMWSPSLPAEKQGEVMHRFVLGLYDLLSQIRKVFPKVMIEGCAGGGGRFDAGMLFYCPQIWCSDNTDPVARVAIQRGTSYGYPVCTMGSHVSAAPNHQTGRNVPLHTRGITAMSGAFGYELDPCRLSGEEKTLIREQIETYHRFEHLIRHGTYYRLTETTEPYTCWEFVSEDRKEVLVTMVVTGLEANAAFPYVKLKGLDPDARYRAEGTQDWICGAALMYGGFVFDAMHGDYPGCQICFRAEQEQKNG